MTHTAVILTSERCGHCRHMRGTGKLLSKTEIVKEKRQPTIQGGYHYDNTYMKSLVTADSGNEAKLRVINLHYKTFNPAEGLTDISVFTLENEKEIRQTMLKEISGGKTNITVYVIGENSRIVSNQDTPTMWSEICNNYVPINIGMYALFFPSLLVFDGVEWTSSIQNKVPIYGFLNGFETKTESPYGCIPTGRNPEVIDSAKFLKQFFDGTKQLKEKPNGVPVMQAPVAEEMVVIPPKPFKSDTVVLPTSGAKRNFRLYVVEK